MSETLWAAVDSYLADLYAPPDPILDHALKNSEAHGLPAINVSPLQGKFLMLLAQLCSARHILEIGTLGGYSTLWLARALPPEGKIITLEVSPKHAEVARANIAYAELQERVEVRLGAALDILPHLAEAGQIFDMVFIDADKPNNPQYLSWALKLTRHGSLIVVDNVIRKGEVLNAESDDPSIQSTRELHAMLAAEPRLRATVLQTVGSKGYDGLVIAQVVG
ncbi:MAG: methyltransferase [Candidatus Thermofonsia Clade 1 bacterium]|uniref:Methyltransferase n=1 Tax=Candidatus Thermofonsia Clade 1 bacterium TaxID=2364210 RepID=A0A2M8P2S8_9CHLR|nr:MAG: methyltransferase [Candidatus Thermofonsia Clade 1 bacterium]